MPAVAVRVGVTGTARTVKAVELTAVPPGVVTEMVPVVAPVGTVALIVVELTTVNVVAVDVLNVTTVAPVRFVPVIVTTVVTGPEDGLNAVIVGMLGPVVVTV